jgi:hypothetical protein
VKADRGLSREEVEAYVEGGEMLSPSPELLKKLDERLHEVCIGCGVTLIYVEGVALDESSVAVWNESMGVWDYYARRTE